jgi:non-ribosomal peptide synthetase component F
VLKSGISIFLEYRNSFVPTEQARNIGNTVDTILTSLLTTPNLLLREVDFFGNRNRLQVEKWNSQPLERIARTVHEVIEDTASRVRNEEAVCSWDGSLTYDELHEHANRLAEHLIEHGVGAEVVVPLCFDKSKWNIVAMLSVLRAGGACTCRFLHSFLPWRWPLRCKSGSILGLVLFHITCVSSSKICNH